MLNPQNTLHRLLGRMLFRLPYNQRKWHRHLSIYRPILENAFKHNCAARLLVMKVLTQIERNNIDGAQQTINVLRPAFAEASRPPELALWHILHALHQHRSGHTRRMAANLKSAAKYGHRFHLAYALHAEYLYDEHHRYDGAEEQYIKALDCLYATPPMTEGMQRLAGTAYAGVADARIMMHRYDDAKAAIRNAEQMHATPEWLLYSKALLNAALRLPAEAQRFLSQLREIDAKSAEGLQEHITLILADKHPHFTAMPIGSPEGISEFWRCFLENERSIQSLIDESNRQAAHDLMLAPLKAMDEYQNDYWWADLCFTDNAYKLTLASGFSRTYTPWMDAIFAACPPELHQRWRIIREP